MHKLLMTTSKIYGQKYRRGAGGIKELAMALKGINLNERSHLLVGSV